MSGLQTLSDETLTIHALAGDNEAFSHLVQRYFSRVYLIAYARLSGREEAEDLAQEVFIRV
ncbi:hypothetical protein NL529_34805, partial [Klebsiella pneumoniae]|nr:hypothetical protein [Klebsiella pneumoniae]